MPVRAVPVEADANAQRTRVPLWLHRVVECILGLLLVTQAVHATSGAAVLAVAGCCIAIPSAFAGGPLALGRWIGPRTHRVLDLFIAAAIALAPFVWSVAPSLSLVTLEATAALSLWLALRTQYVLRQRKPGRPASTSRPRVLPARELGRVAGRVARSIREHDQRRA